MDVKGRLRLTWAGASKDGPGGQLARLRQLQDASCPTRYFRGSPAGLYGYSKSNHCITEKLDTRKRQRKKLPISKDTTVAHPLPPAGFLPPFPPATSPWCRVTGSICALWFPPGSCPLRSPGDDDVQGHV